MSLGPLDRLRLERTILTFDFWLDLRGVRARTRRRLRDELRDNLTAAAADGGARTAVRALGPIRDLARAYSPAPDDGPDLARGSLWAAVTLGLICLSSVISWVTWVQASVASGTTGATGRPLLAPWMEVDLTHTGDALAIGTGFAWWTLLPVLVLFALGAGLWRGLRRRAPVG